MSSRRLAAAVCMTLVACGGTAVDMGGAWEAGADGSVGGKGGTSGSDASADVAEAGSAIPPGCNLPGPEKGEARVRVGNLVTSSQRFDFCFQNSDSTGFGSPLFASSGSDCPNGLAYQELSAPFRVPDSTTLVKVIASGDSCEGPGVVTGLFSATDAVRTVLVLGDGKSGPRLLTGAESVASSASSWAVRFVHAAPRLAELDFGLTNGTDPPGELYAPFGRNYVYGSAIPGFKVSQAYMDGNGYVEPQFPSGTTPFGVAPFDSNQVNTSGQAIFAADLKFRVGSSYTVFMIGLDALDPAYPHQLWACHEYSNDGPVFALCSDNPKY